MAGHDFANGWQGSLKLPTPDIPQRSQTPTTTLTPSQRGGIVVFSGGSAANSLVDVFNQVREANNTTLSYVIPISDNGGSSSELIRVFGGPGKPPRRAHKCKYSSLRLTAKASAMSAHASSVSFRKTKTQRPPPSSTSSTIASPRRMTSPAQSGTTSSRAPIPSGNASPRPSANSSAHTSTAST